MLRTSQQEGEGEGEGEGEAEGEAEAEANRRFLKFTITKTIMIYYSVIGIIYTTEYVHAHIYRMLSCGVHAHATAGRKVFQVLTNQT